MLGHMSTADAHFVPALARMSSTLPWLTILVISAAIAWVMTAALVGAQPVTLPAQSTQLTTETFAIGRACDDGADNWQLVYARTTGRIPANYCPAAR
jgi:hypothetical protein